MEPEECFTAPEVILVYSGKVLEKMTRHTMICIGITDSQSVLAPGTPNPDQQLEATYFEFDDKKLLDIAREVQTRN